MKWHRKPAPMKILWVGSLQSRALADVTVVKLSENSRILSQHEIICLCREKMLKDDSKMWNSWRSKKVAYLWSILIFVIHTQVHMPVYFRMCVLIKCNPYNYVQCDRYYCHKLHIHAVQSAAQKILKTYRIQHNKVRPLISVVHSVKNSGYLLTCSHKILGALDHECNTAIPS